MASWVVQLLAVRVSKIHLDTHLLSADCHGSGKPNITDSSVPVPLRWGHHVWVRPHSLCQCSMFSYITGPLNTSHDDHLWSQNNNACACVHPYYTVFQQHPTPNKIRQARHMEVSCSNVCADVEIYTQCNQWKSTEVLSVTSCSRIGFIPRKCRWKESACLLQPELPQT